MATYEISEQERATIFYSATTRVYYWTETYGDTPRTACSMATDELRVAAKFARPGDADAFTLMCAADRIASTAQKAGIRQNDSDREFVNQFAHDSYKVER